MAKIGGRTGERIRGELTPLSVGLGLLIAVVMTAANVYLGLYAGMTVSASIPAAVLGLAAYRALGRRDIRATNIVQTLASSGESLAAGAIFTIPALVLVGAWQDFRFWPTTLMVVCGGLLGIAFMIPLRRLLIVESPELTYPEGVACAEVLRSGGADVRVRTGGPTAGTASGVEVADTVEFGADRPGGVAYLLKGFLIGAAFKLGSSGLGLLQASAEWARRLGGGAAVPSGPGGAEGGRVVFFGSDLSPALLSVGFITGLGVASQVFLGGAIAWLVGLPMLGLPADLAGAAPLDAAWTLWSKKIRYLGVGAMVVGGMWSIWSIRGGIALGVRRMAGSYRIGGGRHDDGMENAEAPVEVSRDDMPGRQLLALLGTGLLLTFGLYVHLLEAPLLALLTTGVMALAAFLFVGVSSYIVGLVGSSNNPVSGMTISALLGTAAFFLVLGLKGDSAVMATLGVAAVVCCAACSAGDCSQDLKTGYLVGSSPRLQQYAEVIGAVVPVLVIAPVLSLLHHAYTIGSGGLRAPQATLFASLAQGMFGRGEMPVGLIAAGAGIGAALIAADAVLKAMGSRFRVHPMPVAVGLYLPFTLSAAILLGGLARFAADRGGKRGGAEAQEEGARPGILLGSGLIAGESVMGVGVAAAVYFGWKTQVAWHPAWMMWASLGAFLALAVYLARRRRGGTRGRPEKS